MLTAQALFSACRNDGGDRTRVTIADSAGITIVNSVEPEWSEGEGWKIEELPRLEIGTRFGSPDEQFAKVAGVGRLGNGTVVIGDEGTNEIRFFDLSGHLESIAGGTGEGPGEFARLHGVYVTRDDSVVVHDYNGRRMTIMNRTGDFVRSFRLESRPEIAVPYVVGVLRGLQVVAYPVVLPPIFGPATGLIRPSRTVFVFDSHGALVGEIAQLPGLELFVDVENGNRQEYLLPFGHDSYAATSDSLIYVGANDTYEISVYDRTGQRLTIFRRPHNPVPVTSRHLDRHIERLLEDITDPNRRRQVASSMLRMPVPRTFPAYDRLVVDAADYLWVREYATMAETARRWSVFTPTGSWLGTVMMPMGLEVFQIGTNFVLGIWRDELEVEYVRLHALRRNAQLTR